MHPGKPAFRYRRCDPPACFPHTDTRRSWRAPGGGVWADSESAASREGAAIMSSSSKRNLPRVLAMRLSEEDGNRVDAAAAEFGMSGGQYARHVVLEAADIVPAYVLGPRKPKARIAEEDAETLRELLRELQRQGNNLNQLAYQCNARGGIVPGTNTRLDALRSVQAPLVHEILLRLRGAFQMPDKPAEKYHENPFGGDTFIPADDDKIDFLMGVENGR